MAVTKLSRTIGNTEMTLETGKLAPQAGGAVLVTYGDTQVLGTTTASKPREGLDFFPLTVDVEERMYAIGRIPGSFFRREGRPGETAILTARLTDRPLRPSFKDGYRDDVQVILTILGVDHVNPYDVVGMNAASAATCLAGLPFEGPIGSVRMGLIDGEWVTNPTYEAIEEGTFDVIVAGKRNDEGGVDILMIEGEAPDNTWAVLADADGAQAPTEDVVAEGLEAAKRAISEMLEFQQEFIDMVGVTEKAWTPRPYYEEETLLAAEDYAADKVLAALVPDRTEREDKLSEIKEGLKEHLAQIWGEDKFAEKANQVSAAFKSVQKRVMRKRVIDEGVRLDGRGATDIRPLSAEVGVLRQAHGSSLFQRGDTQSLNVTTLGMLRMNQMIDTLDPEDSKRYMHHYNFPPFSTGETGRVGSPRRREIGHGALAERALVPVVPKEDEFPYTLRLVSDILSSNGSTSMAAVCSSTLSLMDAGVPIKAPVAGIAMGMIAEGGTFVTLTDILGAEDALGDMDFKVAGTAEFVTAIQLDMKVSGLPAAELGKALHQAKDARLKILDVMHSAIGEPRTEVNEKAPRILTIQIPVDKIGEVIGPKGKRINEIIAMTGADVDIQDDGTVFVAATMGGSADDAAKMIDEIANPVPVGVGDVYTGTVVKTTTFGAFVNIVPGRDGLVHISKLGKGKRLNNVEDAINEGDTIEVRIDDVDAQGKISLTPIADEWKGPDGEIPQGAPKRGDRDRGDRGDRGRGRDRDGGGRGGDRPSRERRPRKDSN